MSKNVIWRTRTRPELESRRRELLATLGMASVAELAAEADRRPRSDPEAAAHELEAISFLLGEGSITIS
jgi:hypothetical protein